jgi:uncharacterized protein YbjQ (UPF0145 family)
MTGGIMKVIRAFGSLAFVLGLFTAIFVGISWGMHVSDDPIIPLWLKIAVYAILGGILLVMFTVALEKKKFQTSLKEISASVSKSKILLLNSSDIPGRKIKEVLGLVKGHTIYAIWLGNDLSALLRLVLGGELTEYTKMMGKARKIATDRMITQAEALGADAIINLRYMTTSVVGSAAELLAYGTAVKLKS